MKAPSGYQIHSLSLEPGPHVFLIPFYKALPPENQDKRGLDVSLEIAWPNSLIVLGYTG